MESLLTERDVAAKLKVSVAALRRWRLEHRGPQVTKVERLVRYRERDIEAYLSQRTAGDGQRPAEVC
ncbi:MAG: helix-turn-helix domain-containing protein [Acidobacteriota bacterium]